MNKVIKLSDEEVSCILTGLHYVCKYDKDFLYAYILSDLIKKLPDCEVYIGGSI